LQAQLVPEEGAKTMVRGTHARRSRLRVWLSVIHVRKVTPHHEQLDAYRRIEKAPVHPGAAYPGGPPRIIDLTGAESPLPLPYFQSSATMHG
jgi:hypothetical protein